MATEIERKFLVDQKKWETIDKPIPLYTKQLYLSDSQQAVVRVRIKGENAFLTIKGENEGIERKEFEYEIPKEDAIEIMDMSHRVSIEKNRFLIKEEKHVWEVDVFLGQNEGLMIAEIELKNVNETFRKPEWIGDEVSDDPKYYNVNLVGSPFSKW